jgi:uncharacterized protein (TIGR01370 family)
LPGGGNISTTTLAGSTGPGITSGVATTTSRPSTNSAPGTTASPQSTVTTGVATTPVTTTSVTASPTTVASNPTIASTTITPTTAPPTTAAPTTAPPTTPAPTTTIAAATSIRGRLAQAKTFALALGSTFDANTLGQYNVVVVDGEDTQEQLITALHAKGTIVLAYVSVGTLEPYRPWFAEAKAAGYILKYWPQWDEYYAKVSEAGYRDLLLRQTNRFLGKGFDGLFMDNTDMIVDYPDQKAGMISVIQQFSSQLGGDRLLFAQNGDEVVGNWQGLLQGWNHESVSTSYNFDTKTYLKSTPDTAAILNRLRNMKASGIFTSTTDYTSLGDTATESTAIANACSVGAVPFISNIQLNRLPATPIRCP